MSIAFAFDRIAVLPNTAATLRAVAQTVQRGDAAQAAVLVDRLFTAFFIDGENVGDARVLEHIPVGVRRAAGRRKFE
ncbi:DSBA oxidoreductase [Caballeronia terrestris]|uniref:DSBA oxidoreductase n=1 Tax=Caballeronia terrestris TaxID=1226301 RepID=A0A158L3B8_9BURK|nr:DSBA oxidoreductase [Caballeronia terrestris]